MDLRVPLLTDNASIRRSLSSILYLLFSILHPLLFTPPPPRASSRGQRWRPQADYGPTGLRGTVPATASGRSRSVAAGPTRVRDRDARHRDRRGLCRAVFRAEGAAARR